MTEEQRAHLVVRTVLVPGLARPLVAGATTFLPNVLGIVPAAGHTHGVKCFQMTQPADKEAIAAWRQLRIYDQLARAHTHWSGVVDAPRYTVLDELLPALIYINAVSVLDNALERYVERAIGRMPKTFKQDLFGRLNLLAVRGLLADYGAIDAVRGRRNELAHESRQSNWSELDDALAAIETELRQLGIVVETHRYSAKIEHGPFLSVDSPGYIGAANVTVEVLEDDRTVAKYGSSRMIAREGK